MPEVNLTEEQKSALRRSKVVEAFQRVFGSDVQRTEIQRVVWEELRLMSYHGKPSFVADKSGALCPLRAAMTDGRRALFCDIEANVNLTPQGVDPEQQPKTRKR